MGQKRKVALLKKTHFLSPSLSWIWHQPNFLEGIQKKLLLNFFPEKIIKKPLTEVATYCIKLWKIVVFATLNCSHFWCLLPAYRTKKPQFSNGQFYPVRKFVSLKNIIFTLNWKQHVKNRNFFVPLSLSFNRFQRYCPGWENFGKKLKKPEETDYHVLWLKNQQKICLTGATS